MNNHSQRLPEGATVTPEACASRVLELRPQSCAPHECLHPQPPSPQATGMRHASRVSFRSIVSPNSFRKAQLSF